MLSADKIAAFCAANYRELCPLQGAFNIVYIEGLNPDGTPNADRPNEWNDLRLLVTKEGDKWKIVHNAIATTEPGDFYTNNPTNMQGAARIAFGYHPPAWKMGFHKGTQPALVQVGNVMIHRDKNRDGLRGRNEPSFLSVPIGLNHHTTSQRFNGEQIGKYSAGCLVGKNYAQHLDFLSLLRKEVRINAGFPYLYDTWTIPGDKFIAA